MGGYVYMMMNKANTVIYTGVTNDLVKRTHEHKQGVAAGFTKRYRVSKPVYFEQYDLVVEAIEREKQIKAGSRRKKLELIQARNPLFADLHEIIAS